MHDHDTHDLALIAGLAAGDLSGADRTRALAVLDTCSECTTVHADLIAIAAATHALPKRATAPHDYRLSPEQAARLHRRSWLRTILAPFAGAGSAVRPIATAFTSLGLVGLLVVSVLPGMLGGAASLAPERQSTGGGSPQVSGAAAAPSSGGAGALAAPTAAPAGPKDVAAASTVPAAVAPGKNGSTATRNPEAVFGANDNVSSPGPPADAGQESPGSTALPSSIPVNPLLLGSLALLAIGLGLFALRFAGRRLR